jgi:hypothetical protein
LTCFDSLAISSPKVCVEVPAGSIVVINHARSIDVAHYEIRVAIATKIGGYLWKNEDVGSAVQYVIEAQGEPMALSEDFR